MSDPLPKENLPLEPDLSGRRVGAYRTSTQLDRQAGRPMEIDAMFTRPLRAAQEQDVPVPRLELLEFGLQMLNSTRLTKTRK